MSDARLTKQSTNIILAPFLIQSQPNPSSIIHIRQVQDGDRLLINATRDVRRSEELDNDGTFSLKFAVVLTWHRMASGRDKDSVSSTLIAGYEVSPAGDAALLSNLPFTSRVSVFDQIPLVHFLSCHLLVLFQKAFQKIYVMICLKHEMEKKLGHAFMLTDS